MKGYYLESIHPHFKVYRVIIIDFMFELHTYTMAVNEGDKVSDFYKGYVNLGGL